MESGVGAGRGVCMWVGIGFGWGGGAALVNDERLDLELNVHRNVAAANIAVAANNPPATLDCI